MKGFRVELTNQESDFKSGKVNWSTVLHFGTGKKAKQQVIRSDVAVSKLSKIKLLINLDKAIRGECAELSVSAVRLQERYTKNDESDGPGPEKMLKLLKEVIEKNVVKNSERGIDASDWIKVERELPLEIAAGVLACSLLVKAIRQ